ncbi:DUF1878 family protein [Aquibacillus albus]|uniref:DUF1878 family protein n=1 Tax=Aquibacillus albus TaxID=1168171 RepID=A0ABS2MZW5_9BACI|nr:DUF1878 family protein [Aquibacillus albus]MBM7571449.1 hypothetical protein [Aquibacillus albus]
MGSSGELKNLLFHVELLMDICELEKYPFTRLIIKKQMSQKEYEETLRLLETLYSKFVSQKEEGLLDYTDLLLEYVGMLNDKLPPIETLQALKKEGYFPSLTKALLDAHYKIEK